MILKVFVRVQNFVSFTSLLLEKGCDFVNLFENVEIELFNCAMSADSKFFGVFSGSNPV